jgi:hypothetical protein
MPVMVVDPVPDLIESAARSLIAGDLEQALAALERIDQTALASAWSAARAAARRGAWVLAQTAPPVDVTEPSADDITVFLEECFQCAYCGKRTIYPRVLRELSRVFLTQFPYNKNYRNPPFDSHWVYSTHAASLDHIHPKSRTEHPNRRSNLATACWQCNLLKRNRTPEERGLVLSRGGGGPCSWDGLYGLYPEVASAARRAAPSALPPSPGTRGSRIASQSRMRGALVSVAELEPGMWVRATRVGAVARRSYRISTIGADIRMVEGWFQGHDGTYKEGREWTLDVSRPIELLSQIAPKPGSRRRDLQP